MTENPILRLIAGDLDRIEKADDYNAMREAWKQATSAAAQTAVGYYAHEGAIPCDLLRAALDAIRATELGWHKARS